MSEDERLTYRVGEAARLLGIAPSTMWKHIAAGRIPVLKLGGRTLVTRAAIEGLLAEGNLVPHQASGGELGAQVRVVK